jgi:coatomer subunit beta
VSSVEKPCGLILHCDSTEIINVQQVKALLEKGNDDEKIDGLKKVIYMLLNGENPSSLLVPIIRFVTPSKNHTIKKLLLIYWELLDKEGAGDTMLLVW